MRMKMTTTMTRMVWNCYKRLLENYKLFFQLNVDGRYGIHIHEKNNFEFVTRAAVVEIDWSWFDNIAFAFTQDFE